MSSEKKEECGVIGIVSKKGSNIATALHNGLIALQHRGQDAAGMAILCPDGKIEERRGLGLVHEIFKKEDLEITGSIGIGHTRYPTTGRCDQCDVQPSICNGIAVAHNGHIANYEVLKKRFADMGRNFTSTVDAEPIAMLLDEKRGSGVESAVAHVMELLDGSYSDVAIFESKLLVFRDPHAIRPLCWGENEEFIIFASESVVLDINKVPYKGEINGGEMVLINNGKIERKIISGKEPRHCMFEHVYFSRPDSMVNGKLVYQSRKNLGEQLAKEHPVDADVVISVPDSARQAARAFAETLNLPVEEGLIKNRYVGRTFIMPNQTTRKHSVRLKLNPVRGIIDGKRVAVVDDSIVRGTTLKEIVKLVREAGALEVHLRITCPPIKAPCFYGVDMSTYEELIANKKTVDEIAKDLDVDSLGYLSIEGLKKALGIPICTGCLNEEYITKYAKKLANEKKETRGCG